MKNASYCHTKLQSITGSLLVRLRPRGAPLVRRMINLLSGSRLVSGRIQLNADLRLDLRRWQEFLPKWKVASSFRKASWSSPDVLQQ